MTDRWDRAARGLLEAGWLGCAVSVPLFVSPAVSLIFMADKVLLFRCLVELLGLAALLLWLRRPRLRPAPLTMALGAYAVALSLATISGRNPSDGFWGSYLRLFGLFTLLHGGVLYLVVAGHFRAERHWRRLLIAVAVTSVLVCGHALVQWRGVERPLMAWLLRRPDFHWETIASESYRPFATLGNSSFLGAFLVLAAAFALGALLTLPRGRRWPAALWLALLTLVLIVNQTRGAWLGAGALVLVFALLAAPPERRRVIAAAGGGLAVAALFFGILCARFPTARWVTANPVCVRLAHFLQHDRNSSGWYRLDMWRRVGADAAASPGSLLLGYGPESYLLVASRSFEPAYADGSEGAQFMDSTHNIFGDALINSGLLGLVALLAILFLAFRTGLRGLRTATAPAHRAVLITALAALAGYLVQGMFLFDHVVTLVYLSLTLGLITAGSRPGSRAREEEINTETRRHGGEGKERNGGSRESPARPGQDPSAALPLCFRLSPCLRVCPENSTWLACAPLLDFHSSRVARSAIANSVLISFLMPLLVNAGEFRAQVLKRRADELTAAGRPAEATAALREACRLVPHERTYRVALATAVASGAPPPGSDPAALRAVFRAAERELLQAVAMDPGDVRTYWPLGLLYQFWGVVDRQKFAAGEAVYRRAAALSPRRQRTYWAWGQLLLAEGKRDEALAQYRRALALDPSVAASQRALGQCYVRLEQPEQAEPLLADAWRQLGRRPGAALLRPQQAADHEALGLAFLARGRRDKARLYLTRALDLDPQRTRAREALERLAQRQAASARTAAQQRGSAG